MTTKVTIVNHGPGRISIKTSPALQWNNCPHHEINAGDVFQEYVHGEQDILIEEIKD